LAVSRIESDVSRMVWVASGKQSSRGIISMNLEVR
jgi:hypothetical protein